MILHTEGLETRLFHFQRNGLDNRLAIARDTISDMEIKH